MNDPVSGRRPLKSRGMPVFQRLAARLAASSVTPNMISVCSVLFGLAAAVALALTSQTETMLYQRVLWVVAACCIQGRLIANLLDGMVAIEGGKSSAVGDLYNEVPDRISDSLIFVGAGMAVGGTLYLGLLAGLLAVFVAYVRAIGASVGAGQVFAGPFAKPQRMALMTLMCVLMTLLPSRLAWTHEETGIGIVGIALAIISVGCVVTSWRRLVLVGGALRASYALESDTDD